MSDELDHLTPISFLTMPPISSLGQFASMVGVTPDTVRGWVEKDILPTVKIGKRRFIDNVTFSSQLKSGTTIFSSGHFSEEDD